MVWLIATLGITPAVLTEAIWHLEMEKRLEVDRVTGIATREGLACAKPWLFQPGGAMERLRQVCGKPESWLADGDSFLWAEAPLSLHDNRSHQDALAMDRTCREVIRVAQERGEGQVAACISGGRKTMSSSLQQAMTFLARSNDWAFHVLLRDSDHSVPGLAKSAEKAGRFAFPDDPEFPEFVGQVALDAFEIPIVRLRDFALGMGYKYLIKEDFIGTLQRTVNRAAVLPRLRLDLSTLQIHLDWGQGTNRPATPPLPLHQAILLAGWIRAGGPISRAEMARPMEEVIEDLRESRVITHAEAEDLYSVVDAWMEPDSGTVAPIQTDLNSFILDLHPALERFTIKSRWGRKVRPERPLAGRFGFDLEVYSQGLASVSLDHQP